MVWQYRRGRDDVSIRSPFSTLRRCAEIRYLGHSSEGAAMAKSSPAADTAIRLMFDVILLSMMMNVVRMHSWSRLVNLRTRCAGSVLVLSLMPLATGCLAGGGEGWVVGSLSIDSCSTGGDPYQDGDFDLRADFFGGDPVLDSTDNASLRQSTLLIRIQESSNLLEESNGLLIQFHDMVAAASQFSLGQPIPLTDDSLCPGCTSVNTVARMQLGLFSTCPGNRSPLSANAARLVDTQRGIGEEDATCMLPETGAMNEPCPKLSATDRAELDAICAEPDFSSRVARRTIEERLGGGACLYLCEFGDAERGSPRADLEGFEILFGDTVSAIFSAQIVDTRALRLSHCALGTGQLTGRFRLEVVRNRVVQPFP